ncbi:MAG TPA: hypothetical protein DCG57_01680 [Candidatus Riflebacteria bacterium]|nr:hypothetical protein [Candidatus Riflebacteria bacterium]
MLLGHHFLMLPVRWLENGQLFWEVKKSGRFSPEYPEIVHKETKNRSDGIFPVRAVFILLSHSS